MKPASIRTAFLIAGVTAACAQPSWGQSALVLEARMGASVPVGSFRTGPEGEYRGAAPGLGVQFGLLRGRRTYVYVGFSQSRVDCGDETCAQRWVATQWDAGVRVELGAGTSIVPWVRAGVVSPTVEHVALAPTPAGAPRFGTSERGWGGEVGAGVRVALTERWSLSPGARYAAVDVGRRGLEDLRFRSLMFDVGVVVGF